MAGVSVEGEKGRRRSVDSQINMIPMIDLLMVTISFLLITAVWTKMSRVEASARAPGDPVAPPCDAANPCEPTRELHVDMRQPDRFSLTWREHGAVVRTWDVTRRLTAPLRVAGGTFVQFPELKEALGAEYQPGEATPGHLPRAVLHAANDAPYEDMVAAMDAIYSVRRPEKGAPPAFLVTLSTD